MRLQVDTIRADDLLTVFGEPIALAEHNTAPLALIGFSKARRAVASFDGNPAKAVRSADRAPERNHEVRHAVQAYSKDVQ